MNNVGVFEMAERREKRAAEQQDMLARCGLPLVCINMNIAGPVKLRCAHRLGVLPRAERRRKQF